MYEVPGLNRLGSQGKRLHVCVLLSVECVVKINVPYYTVYAHVHVCINNIYYVCVYVCVCVFFM